ncbi:phospholipid/cholesterol/gamma-HCH transport system substrate-binding protein [Nocardioides zeae]|uniref:Phospholipid/cholesterol/gamma-HCH transport system substrate-binding protein n=2 Tax=Nocardioides zeae TaxID=1457234 RepID=A0ACC6IKR0_9ACTN|nr:MCE family protein [Nocardioides zeae]MDQ1105118.1 phospholipid/cholesterol/gamma-HCH transport system substrate-binding protein [Nocardioides zeae]MDR6175167.1 phospholipid/cholesterol/gamma-HCH transport system substrate-binding protein [Nocardioides zeae]MDR6211340.1 phospholipid/cholesterol/gamma-HCH transport system substrate-binding protein [Nocardioides zeae]
MSTRAQRSRDRRARLLRSGALLLALAAVVLAVTARSAYVDGRSTTVVADFDSAVGLYVGSDVQVLGVPVGEVTDIEPGVEAVRVTMRLDPGRKVAAGTAAVIVAPTVVSDRYVQLTEPWTEGAALADGAVIDADRTAVPVEIDELYTSLEDVSTRLGPNGANADGALSAFLEVAAENLDGTGADLNTMISEFSDLSATVSGVDADLFATIGHLAELSEMLEVNDETVGSATSRFAEVADYLAADRDDLATAVQELGAALAVLDDFIADNRSALRTSVDNLVGPTQTLVNQRASLEELLRMAPLTLQNFLQAYDPATGSLQGRANLNEANLWSSDGLSARSSSDAPPVLLPGIGETDR